jgi:hypothetical protein
MHLQVRLVLAAVNNTAQVGLLLCKGVNAVPPQLLHKPSKAKAAPCFTTTSLLITDSSQRAHLALRACSL